MSERYEFGITGQIGPLIRSCLPELIAAEEGESTVLTGTAEDPTDLKHLLDLLNTRGLTPLDIRLTYRTEAEPPR